MIMLCGVHVCMGYCISVFIMYGVMRLTIIIKCITHNQNVKHISTFKDSKIWFKEFNLIKLWNLDFNKDKLRVHTFLGYRS